MKASPGAPAPGRLSTAGGPHQPRGFAIWCKGGEPVHVGLFSVPPPRLAFDEIVLHAKDIRELRDRCLVELQRRHLPIPELPV